MGIRIPGIGHLPKKYMPFDDDGLYVITGEALNDLYLLAEDLAQYTMTHDWQYNIEKWIEVNISGKRSIELELTDDDIDLLNEPRD